MKSTKYVWMVETGEYVRSMPGGDCEGESFSVGGSLVVLMIGEEMRPHRQVKSAEVGVGFF